MFNLLHSKLTENANILKNTLSVGQKSGLGDLRLLDQVEGKMKIGPKETTHYLFYSFHIWVSQYNVSRVGGEFICVTLMEQKVFWVLNKSSILISIVSLQGLFFIIINEMHCLNQ